MHAKHAVIEPVVRVGIVYLRPKEAVKSNGTVKQKLLSMRIDSHVSVCGHVVSTSDDFTEPTPKRCRNTLNSATS